MKIYEKSSKNHQNIENIPKFHKNSQFLVKNIKHL